MIYNRSYFKELNNQIRSLTQEEINYLHKDQKSLKYLVIDAQEASSNGSSVIQLPEGVCFPCSKCKKMFVTSYGYNTNPDNIVEEGDSVFVKSLQCPSCRNMRILKRNFIGLRSTTKTGKNICWHDPHCTHPSCCFTHPKRDRLSK